MAKKPIKTAKKPAPKKVVKKTVKKVVKKATHKTIKPVEKKAAKPLGRKPAKAAPKSKKTTAKKVVSKPVAVKHVEKKLAPKQNMPKTEVKRHAQNLVAQPRAHKSDDNRARYSDKELLEFKNLIDEKLESARQELKYLNDQINRKDDNGTDDTENKFGSIEDGSVAMEREYMTQMATRQATYIDHLEKALMRIDNKTYGICRVTGKLIDKERLRAVPHATLSIEAKMIQSK